MDSIDRRSEVESTDEMTFVVATKENEPWYRDRKLAASEANIGCDVNVQVKIVHRPPLAKPFNHQRRAAYDSWCRRWPETMW